MLHRWEASPDLTRDVKHEFFKILLKKNKNENSLVVYLLVHILLATDFLMSWKHTFQLSVISMYVMHLFYFPCNTTTLSQYDLFAFPFIFISFVDFYVEKTCTSFFSCSHVTSVHFVPPFQSLSCIFLETNAVDHRDR